MVGVKKVIIVHGWQGSPQGNWFPWLKTELEKLGHEVLVPAMPNADHPQQSAWVAHLHKVIGSADPHPYLVGHSLGVIAILRYLETLPEGEEVGGAILVAGFSQPIGKAALDSFFTAPLDYQKVKRAARSFIAIHSDNDPYVPIAQGELLRDEIGAQLVIMKNAGHVNAEDGFYRLPIVLENLQAVIRYGSTA